MKTERETLRRIEALPEPRHLFVLPAWVDPAVLDHLIVHRYLTCIHHQRDDNGALVVVMGLNLTAAGNRLLHPRVEWRQLALKGSLAGASFAVMSLLILYLG